MRTGETVALAEEPITLVEPLDGWPGNEVYLGQTRSGPDVVVRMLPEAMVNDMEAQEAFEGEIAVLRALNIAEGTTEPHHVPRVRSSGRRPDGRLYLVQEHCAGVPLTLITPLHEVDALLIGEQLCHVLTLAHSRNIARGDANPDDLLWDGQCLHVIRWSQTGTGQVEQRLDLVRVGALLHLALTGQAFPLSAAGEPAGRPGYGSALWHSRSSGSQMILRRALNRQSCRRYTRATELREDLNWQRSALQAQASGNWRQLSGWAEEARWSRKRPERVLAACELAERLSIPDAETRERLAQLPSEAQVDLDRDVLRPLGNTRDILYAGSYQDAIDEFDRQIRADPGDRLTRYYLALALALRTLHQSAGWNTSQCREVIEALERVILDLVRENFNQATIALSRLNPALTARVEGLSELRNAAEAGRLVSQAERAMEEAHYDEALNVLDQALRIAPGESWITDLRAQTIRDRDQAQAAEKVLTELANDASRWDFRAVYEKAQLLLSD